MNLELDGRTVLVTGASSGIGRVTAIAFAAEGARVAVGYHANASGAAGTAGTIEAAGGVAMPVRLDLGSEHSIAAAVDRITDVWRPSTFSSTTPWSGPGFPWPGTRSKPHPPNACAAHCKPTWKGRICSVAQ